MKQKLKYLQFAAVTLNTENVIKLMCRLVLVVSMCVTSFKSKEMKKN